MALIKGGPFFVFLTLLWILDFTWGGYIPPGPRYRCPNETLLFYPCKCIKESDIGINVHCENSNLASISVGLNNLATFRLPIEELTIDRCHIGRLFGSLLYKLILRKLYIKDTPIETIDEHTFLGVNNTLNELHIVNSSLVEFPKLAFKILGNLTVLNLDQHKISTLTEDVFSGSDAAAKLQKIHLTNGQLASLPIESLQPLKKLKTIDLHGNQLKDLKRNQFRGLRDVEILDLSFNNIVKIDSSHLADLTKLSFCNVSHNSITELTRGAFARNAVLRVLNMSHNKIKRLDSNSFRGMRFMRRLYLSDNLISDVGRGTFGSVTRIGTIDLARNFIKKIDFQMFFQLNFIEILDVSENNVTEIQKLAFKDLYLTNINLSRNAIAKIETGAFENCANITVLDLSYNKLTNIPKKAFDETTYATELQLSYNSFTDMNQIPLHNMTGLKILNVSHNNIANIPRHTFPKLYELHTIDLSHNNVSEIFNAVFQVLFSLRTLDLSHNNLQQIKPSTFGSLPTLLDLNLSYNKLRDIARGSLARLASTRILSVKGNRLQKIFQLPISTGHLDFSDNELEEIPPKVWPSMNALLSLDVSGNKLENNLQKGSFHALLTLQRLNLNRNGITRVPWEALSELTSLQYLYLENNNITYLPRAAFGHLPVIFEINLAYNQLNNVSVRAFEGLLQVLTINMTHNNISHIPNGALQGVVALRALDLSHNRIEKIDNKTHGLLDDCLSLERLNLSHNRISFISRKTFPSNPYIPYRLRDIDLSYNAMPVLTYDIVFGTGKVERLNLSHNSIADIRRGAIGNLTRLQMLDLSHNKLEDISTDVDVFRLPYNASELYLSHNRLSSLPWRQLANVAHMNTLDLQYNNFELFGKELTNIVENNTAVFFQGNPLNCDCFVRPLHRYFTKTLELDDNYKEIKCASPNHVLGQNLYKVPEDRLVCPINVNTTRLMENEPELYDVTPDFKFRDVQVHKNKIFLKWYVTNNEDIADPYIIIRDTANPQYTVYETTLPYFKRTLEIDTSGELSKGIENTQGEIEICLLARDSKTDVRGWNKHQCKDIPKQLALTGTAATTTPTSYSFGLLCVFVTLVNLYL